MLVILLGALLVIAGVIHLAAKAIWKGPLSRSTRSHPGAANDTLEPPGPGITVFGLSRNWPGLALILAGGILLLAGAMM